MASGNNIQARTPVPVKGVLIAMMVGAAAGVSRINFADWFTYIFTGPGSYSRIFAFLLILANLKNLPGVWHYRVLNAIFSNMEFTRTLHFAPKRTIKGPHGPSSLFQPCITQSRSPLLECDYNFHKSNSTYFTDLDVSRSHLVTALLRQSVRNLVLNPRLIVGPDGKPSKGGWAVMLGAVQCSFKREIKPYEGYEMWTRVLCWDRKWIYTVTHFVAKGAVKPDGVTLDDGSAQSKFWWPKGRKGSGKKDMFSDENGAVITSGIPSKAIFATSIAKYVAKIGRLTIHPEVMLGMSGLLPPRPGGWATMSGEADPVVGVATVNPPELETSANEPTEEWDWKRVEAENKRGLEYAEHFAKLDDLAEEFTGKGRPALGVFRDFLW